MSFLLSEVATAHFVMLMLMYHLIVFGMDIGIIGGVITLPDFKK